MCYGHFHKHVQDVKMLIFAPYRICHVAHKLSVKENVSLLNRCRRIVDKFSEVRAVYFKTIGKMLLKSTAYYSMLWPECSLLYNSQETMYFGSAIRNLFRYGKLGEAVSLTQAAINVPSISNEEHQTEAGGTAQAITVLSAT